jgi:hypothetical protein
MAASIKKLSGNIVQRPQGGFSRCCLFCGALHAQEICRMSNFVESEVGCLTKEWVYAIMKLIATGGTF